MMKVKVLKFGGSSVETLEKMQFVANKIIAFKNNGNEKLVVVVSAIGKTTQNLYDNALKLAKHPSPRELDLLLSTGEVVAISYLGIILKELGIDTISLTGKDANIFTTGCFQNSKIINIDTSIINEYLNEGKIVIVAGYQGVNEKGDVTTLGREGSDTTAVNLAHYLDGECIIFTDVEGVYEVDPRIICNSKIHHNLSYNDLLMLSKHGAKVIARSAIEFALDKNIPLVIKSTFKDGLGTIINNYNNKDFVGITYQNHIKLIKNNLSNEEIHDLVNKGIIIEKMKDYASIYSNEFSVDDFSSCDEFKSYDLLRLSIIGNALNNPNIRTKILKYLEDLNLSVVYSWHKESIFSIFINESIFLKTINYLYYYVKDEVNCERD